ncbi:hypothetical protein [Rhodopseudomonas palustris]|uniref:hypothetical protein n=1 Tax=Rhodopseudomonas palustris TaxID=1076 RepID=UPI000E5C3839|nr:hypothetical protein [Rhodopseudomonas palustris]QLH70428.1 hypothetical protein HZF03_06380 [Rhodopseudomonas palustris]RHZ97108.1 hypothetical protein D1920_17680 [Rhodopseudomonas palustris]
MSDDSAPATKPTTNSPVIACDSLHAVALDDATLAAVDQWATSRLLSRTEALGRLVQLGLSIAPGARPPLTIAPDRAVELAASQIHALIDPEAPLEERDRRIARLVEGPPEFVEARVDLPRRRATDLLPDGNAMLPPPAPGTPQRRATDRSALPD